MRTRLKPARAALPLIAAHPLRERQKPFDDPDWLFELKYDGYRGLVYLERGRGRLINRREMKRFSALTWALVPPIDADTAIRLARPPEQDVHHDHDNCPNGKEIGLAQRRLGTLGRQRCRECERLS